MEEFHTQYFNPMDRDYGHSTPATESTNDVGVGMGDFGMSLALGPVPNVHAVGAKLRAGTRTLEFVFTGQGKGSGQGQTPEMYGLKQRQALEEMGRANKVDFTTHATIGIYGLAGLGQQGFSKEQKNFFVNEVKRAVEFAADVGRGGPIVVHTGEFQRPVVDAEWNQREGDPWKGKFSMYEDEEGRTTFKVVDRRTGGFLEEARKNRKVTRPLWKRYREGDEYWQEKGGKEYRDEKGNLVRPGDYIDLFGHRVGEEEEKVPVYDKENQRFATQTVGWEELELEAKEMTERARKFWREHKGDPEKWKSSIWLRFQEAASEQEIAIRPEEAYLISQLENQVANAKGYALYYSGNIQENIEHINKLRKAKKLYDEIEEATDPEERWKLKRHARQIVGDLLPVEMEMPSETINKALRELEKNLKHQQEISSAQWAQAENTSELIRNVESAETYALREAFDSYAVSAINAMMHSDRLMKEGKMKKPLTIAMENLFPESYGAHPDELVKLVLGSRERMVEMLKKRGYSEENAKKEAEEHITSTMDTGHLNMWRKYWKGDTSKSMKENDEDYNKWMLDKLGELARKKVIGHVHIDDNYGYHDDHLAPGEGNAPIREMIKVLKDNNYKGELIVEPGADYTTDASGFHSVMKTWRLFGSPVYGAMSGVPQGKRNWSQVGYGWFGQTDVPYFVFGAYSPSEDWTLWSGVPLE